MCRCVGICQQTWFLGEEKLRGMNLSNRSGDERALQLYFDVTGLTS